MPEQKPSGAYYPPVYHGDQDDERLPYEGPDLRARPDPVNAGRRAVREGSGVASGSGAAAGGTGGIDEDPDSDPVGGSGANAMPVGQGSNDEESVMSDDKTIRRPGDDKRISLSEDYEVEYWANRFGVSRDRLKTAVDKVGSDVDAVARELND